MGSRAPSEYRINAKAQEISDSTQIVVGQDSESDAICFTCESCDGDFEVLITRQEALRIADALLILATF